VAFIRALRCEEGQAIDKGPGGDKKGGDVLENETPGPIKGDRTETHGRRKKKKKRRRGGGSREGDRTLSVEKRGNFTKERAIIREHLAQDRL